MSSRPDERYAEWYFDHVEQDPEWARDLINEVIRDDDKAKSLFYALFEQSFSNVDSTGTYRHISDLMNDKAFEWWENR